MNPSLIWPIREPKLTNDVKITSQLMNVVPGDFSRNLSISYPCAKFGLSDFKSNGNTARWATMAKESTYKAKWNFVRLGL